MILREYLGVFVRRAKLWMCTRGEVLFASVLQAASKRRSRQIGAAFVPDVCLLAASLHTTQSLHTTRSAHRCGDSTRASRRAAGVPREASFAAH